AHNAKFIETSSKATQQDEGISSAAFFPINKVLHMIDKGDLSHGQSITAIMLYFSKKNLILSRAT
ncbi:MAG TPA: hypothetical protein PLK35_02820, partial [Candidatus Moranbacteria bacterium]|nr:hypothetical protein [Candidatus Moranbacteria bacterium]